MNMADQCDLQVAFAIAASFHHRPVDVVAIADADASATIAPNSSSSRFGVKLTVSFLFQSSLSFSLTLYIVCAVELRAV